jgi:hypothetical protein
MQQHLVPRRRNAVPPVAADSATRIRYRRKSAYVFGPFQNGGPFTADTTPPERGPYCRHSAFHVNTWDFVRGDFSGDGLPKLVQTCSTATLEARPSTSRSRSGQPRAPSSPPRTSTGGGQRGRAHRGRRAGRHSPRAPPTHHRIRTNTRSTHGIATAKISRRRKNCRKKRFACQENSGDGCVQ